MNNATHVERQLAREIQIDVGRHLLSVFQKDLEMGALSVEDTGRAIIICQALRHEEAIKEDIENFLMLADQITDGIFSATLDAANQKEKH